MTRSLPSGSPASSTRSDSATRLCPRLTVRSRHQEVTYLGRIVGEREQVDVAGRDLALGDHSLPNPLDHPAPVVGADEHHRELGDLPGLDERERLPELVHGPEAAGEDHEPTRVADEHDLADEEVVELEADVAVGVAALLEGQLDAQPDRQCA